VFAASLFDRAVLEVGAEPCGLPGHPVGSWRVTGNAVDSAGEVQRLLNRPELLMLIGRIDLCGVAHGHPADRHHRAGRQDRVHVNDAVDPDFGAAPSALPGNNAAPVATTHPFATRAPFKWACGPTSTSSPMDAGHAPGPGRSPSRRCGRQHAPRRPRPSVPPRTGHGRPVRRAPRRTILRWVPRRRWDEHAVHGPRCSRSMNTDCQQRPHSMRPHTAPGPRSQAISEPTRGTSGCCYHGREYRGMLEE
jgi:hypothetical protein